MKQEHIYLKDLVKELKEWTSELKLQRDQVKIFEERLGEVLIKNTDQEVKAFGEQFQNQMIRQNEVIDILEHDLNAEMQKHESYAKEHTIALDHQYFEDHKELRSRAETNTKLFKEMRDNFYSFIEKWI